MITTDKRSWLVGCINQETGVKVTLEDINEAFNEFLVEREEVARRDDALMRKAISDFLGDKNGY